MGADLLLQSSNRRSLFKSRKREREADNDMENGEGAEVLHVTGAEKNVGRPHPDFEEMIYPRGWAVGKKRKLVNVDVVESMRRIAVHEMNRKDREIDGLKEQLEEDCRTMEQLQLQLQKERARRLEAERQNSWLNEQMGTLMDMMQEDPATTDTL